MLIIHVNDGWTALIWAAYGGHVGVCELLIEKGADVEAGNKDGKTALDYMPDLKNYLKK